MEKKLHDETIMPDGRPLFAWRNEIEMGRSEITGYEAKKRELDRMMQLLHIVAIEQTREFHTGDYLFRVRLSDAVVAKDQLSILENAEITRA